jgi:hypothetical protein
MAAGHRDDALGLLSRAEVLDHQHPSYYSSAWVALGRVFIETGRLGTCPFSPADGSVPTTSANRA